ncbi:MAG TPA: TspO/MBR family protein [Thermoanaerobaculia bacterium]|jgi:tryptophan-rich sensory protein
MDEALQQHDVRGGLRGAAMFGGSVAAVAALGGLFNPAAGDTRAWYDALQKPWFTPPDWVFGPVWTTLYVLIAIAGYRLWRAERGALRSAALRWWTVQLLLNAAWSPVFFGAKRPTAALIVIVLMLAAIAALIATSRKVDRGAAWMLVPYLAWVTLATLLNEEIVRLAQ